MIDVALAAACTRILTAVCICIGAAEYLAIRSQFTGSGIFSDDVHLLNWTRGPQLLVAVYRVMFSYHAAVIGHGARLGLALMLTLPLDMRLYAIILVALFLLQLHTVSLSAVGHDGSDQMMLVVMPALAVAYAFRLSGPCAWVALWFIAAEALLAYVTSGFSKLISPVWRSGRALQLIFNTACYGSPQVSEWLTMVPSMAFIGCWTVILLECCMPLVLILPLGVMVSMLAVAMLFHIGCAVTMGLNCFVWAFASTFPVIYVCNVDRSVALSGFRGINGESKELLLGGVFALVVVAIILIRYYEVFPGVRPLTEP